MMLKQILLIFYVQNYINIVNSEMLCNSKLALQWPRTVCQPKRCPGQNTRKSKCRDDVKESLNQNDGKFNRFTIHGLWEDGDDCNNSSPEFDIDKVQDYNESLWQNMPNLLGNNTDFWEHEWNKHGNKTGLEIGEYFNTTLQLYDKYGYMATRSLLDDCFAQNTEVNIESLSQCIIPNQTIEIAVYRDYFMEIRICFNRTFHSIDCAPPKNSNISIRLPPVGTITKRSAADVSFVETDITDEFDECPLQPDSSQGAIAFLARKLMLLPLLHLGACIYN
ncbi:uncharacterized protein LOC134269276 isoform X2 [Saccostrea cucullata]|uniref:uncharacterized protein LOC134269276 isoform X2 n=1 Tax=Saccostrea cuccullata TaxID=36930 RepID=UPI002ED20392